jgi:hypothetical protein
VLQQSITPLGRVRPRLIELEALKPRVTARQIDSPPALSPTAIFLSAQEAAALLRISPVTLGRWRIEGQGPAFQKFGRRVVYAREELIAWARRSGGLARPTVQADQKCKPPGESQELG